MGIVNINKGISLLTECADSGDAFSCYQLGRLYFFGTDGLEHNKEKAMQYLDFSVGTLSVRRTVQRINKRGSSEVIIGSPKSKTSICTVPIPAFLLDLLSQNKKDDRLFLISGTVKPAEPRTMQYRFKAVLKVCQIRNIPFHLLRHTYATVCIENGFDTKTLSELLGHADASITLNRYVHSSMQMK